MELHKTLRYLELDLRSYFRLQPRKRRTSKSKEQTDGISTLFSTDYLYLRQHHNETMDSRPISPVKPCLAWLVLGWVTALVYPFCSGVFIFYNQFFLHIICGSLSWHVKALLETVLFNSVPPSSKRALPHRMLTYSQHFEQYGHELLKLTVSSFQPMLWAGFYSTETLVYED